MEKYLRQYFWTINLLTIAVCSLFLAKSVNTFIGAALANNQEQKAVVMENSKTEIANVKDYDKNAKTNIFDGTSLAPELPDFDPLGTLGETTPLPEDPEEYSVTTECPLTSLQGTLMGTMASTVPSQSFAIIQNSEKKTITYEIGDSYPGGASVVAVVRHKVFLKSSSGRIECFYHGAMPEKKKAPKKNKKSTGDDDIRKVSETEYIISQGTITGAMENLNLLATQARIVPSFKNGVSNGFRVYSIKPGSFFEKVGIKNGDVIQRVNNMDMNSPEKALQIYSQLRTEKTLSLDLLRRGSKISLDYTIQ